MSVDSFSWVKKLLGRHVNLNTVILLFTCLVVDKALESGLSHVFSKLDDNNTLLIVVKTKQEEVLSWKRSLDKAIIQYGIEIESLRVHSQEQDKSIDEVKGRVNLLEQKVK